MSTCYNCCSWKSLIQSVNNLQRATGITQPLPSPIETWDILACCQQCCFFSTRKLCYIFQKKNTVSCGTTVKPPKSQQKILCELCVQAKGAHWSILLLTPKTKKQTKRNMPHHIITWGVSRFVFTSVPSQIKVLQCFNRDV